MDVIGTMMSGTWEGGYSCLGKNQRREASERGEKEALRNLDIEELLAGVIVRARKPRDGSEQGGPFRRCGHSVGVGEGLRDEALEELRGQGVCRLVM